MSTNVHYTERNRERKGKEQCSAADTKEYMRNGAVGLNILLSFY